MNRFRGILDLQVQSVLEALGTQQDSRCREIESAAARKAEQLLNETRHRMRERVHRAVTEERQRRETALLESRHRIETARRRRVQARYRDFLQDAMPLLQAELEQCWQDTETRQSWCEMLLGEAADRLPGERWTIEHPEDWSGSETQWLARAFAARDLPKPAFVADAEIAAGLRVRLGSACLDATLEGLLADRDAVEARLLAAWERQLRAQGEEADD